MVQIQKFRLKYLTFHGTGPIRNGKRSEMFPAQLLRSRLDAGGYAAFDLAPGVHLSAFSVKKRRRRKTVHKGKILLNALAVFVLSAFRIFSPLESLAQTAPAALFKAKCSVCHGANGAGDTALGKGLKIRDLRSGEVQLQTDAQLGTITSCGKGNMPAYENKLTGDQIADLVAYIRKLAAKN